MVASILYPPIGNRVIGYFEGTKAPKELGMVALLERINGRLVGENQWLPCWRGSMVALLEGINGCLVGENQWLPCWRGAVVGLLERSNGCTVGDYDRMGNCNRNNVM